MDIYSVYLAGEKIGTAEVMQQGMFYRIRCLCELSGSVPVRIIVAAENQADLGLCVPMKNGFGLECRIPIKRIGRGDLRFSAKPKHTKQEHLTVVSPDEPFAYITKLKDAYLIKYDAITGIAFRTTDQSQDLQDSGQNP